MGDSYTITCSYHLAYNHIYQGEITINTRKLIHFGKSAFCITMPHTWLKKNKIKKGDSLVVQETSRNSLEILPTRAFSDESNELVIDISDKSTDELTHTLLSVYLDGYTQIILTGSNAGKVALVRKQVHEFIAAEIMEVTSNKIVIHVLGDIRAVDLNSIITRMGHITKSLFSETIGSIDSKVELKDLVEKGLEVQRQVLFARRAIKYAINNSVISQKANLTSSELLYVSYIIYFFGTIEEYILKLAGIINNARFNDSKDVLTNQTAKKQLKTLILQVADYYGKVLDIYNVHKKLEKSFFNDCIDFEGAIDRFRKNNPHLWTPILAEYIHMIVLKIREIELIMMSMDDLSNKPTNKY